MQQETHLDVEKELGITTLSMETEQRKDEEQTLLKSEEEHVLIKSQQHCWHRKRVVECR